RGVDPLISGKYRERALAADEDEFLRVLVAEQRLIDDVNDLRDRVPLLGGPDEVKGPRRQIGADERHAGNVWQPLHDLRPGFRPHLEGVGLEGWLGRFDLPLGGILRLTHLVGWIGPQRKQSDGGKGQDAENEVSRAGTGWSCTHDRALPRTEVT